MEDPTNPSGCLVTNALAERGGAGGSVARALAAVVSICEERLYETIRRGQRARIISPTEDPRALARFFLGVSQATAIMSKVSGDHPSRDILRVSMSVLAQTT